MQGVWSDRTYLFISFPSFPSGVSTAAAGKGLPSRPTARPQVPAALGLVQRHLVFSRLLPFILPQGPGGFLHSSGQPGSGGAGRTPGVKEEGQRSAQVPSTSSKGCFSK